MGAGNSKPDEALSQHVFTSDTTTRYSGQFVESLQDSPSSDATRAASTELKIQSRVTTELERLLASEQEKLKSISESLSADSSAPPSESQPYTDGHPTLTEKLTGAAAEKEKLAKLSSGQVNKEIEELRRKLAERKKVEKVDAEVQKAKDELVACLRLNDRRPLDCWREKEEFKRQVGRLEREFVKRTVQ